MNLLPAREDQVTAGRTSPPDTSQLDGLRFLAFLMVFWFHYYGPEDMPWLVLVELRGWVGVDIFFALSSFLLFTLFEREISLTGTFSVSKFYARRIFRIYPLMVGYTLLMLVMYGPQNDVAFAWLLSIVAGVCNLAAALPGAAVSIADTQHLWTLAYEMQVYLALPFSFLVCAAYGRRALVAGLLGLALISLAARLALVMGGIPPSMIYLMPILRPESSMAGLLIAMGLSRRMPEWGAWTGLIAAIAALILLPDIHTATGAVVISYASALFAAALLHITLYSRALASILTFRPIAYLGKISFGLYVFHIWATNNAAAFLSGLPVPQNHLTRGIAGIALTALVASVSYWAFERPINSLKPRPRARPSTTQPTGT